MKQRTYRLFGVLLCLVLVLCSVSLPGASASAWNDSPAAAAMPAADAATDTAQDAAPLGTLTISVPLVMDGGRNLPMTAKIVVTGPNGYSKSISYGSFMLAQTAVLPGLAAGAYTVSVEDGDRDGYALTVDYTVDGAATNEAVLSGGNATVTVTPHYTSTTGALTIEAPLRMDGLNLPWSARIIVSGPDGYSKSLTYGSFMLSQRTTLTGLPAGTYTTTVEGGERDGYALQLSYTVAGTSTNEAVLTAGGSAAVSISAAYTKAEPAKTGTLSIYVPLVMDGNPFMPDTAKVLVTGPDGYRQELPYDTFMTAQQTTLTGLADGTYTVTVEDAERDGYTLEVVYTSTSQGKENEAIISGGSTGKVIIYPTYRKIVPTGSLTIQVPLVTDDGRNMPASAEILIRSQDTGAYLSVPYGSFMADQQYTIPDLAAGAYTVSVQGAELDNYTLTLAYTSSTAGESNQVTVTGGNAASIRILPTYAAKAQTGCLYLYAPNLYTASGSLSDAVFTVTSASGSTEIPYRAFRGSRYLLSDLPVGVYTVSLTGAEREGYTRTTQFYSNPASDTAGTVTISANRTATMSIYTSYQLTTGLSLTISVQSDGAETPSGAMFLIKGPNSYQVIRYSAFQGGSYICKNLMPGTYTVSELNARVSGFTLDTAYQAAGQATSTVALSAEAAAATVTITNTYSVRQPVDYLQIWEQLLPFLTA